MTSTPLNPPAGRPTHRLQGPAELLRAVPYLLGFHPEDSLLLIGLDHGRLVVTARVDLRGAGEPELLADTLGALVRGGAAQLVTAVWDRPEPSGAGGPHPGEGPLPWSDVARASAAVADELGLDIVDQLLVRDGRWWSYVCAEPRCCPGEGHPLPDEPSAFAAAATVEGVVALPNRAALVAVLDPSPDHERQQLAPAIEAAEHAAVAAVLDASAERRSRSIKRAVFAEARAAHEPGWAAPDDDTLAGWAVALADIPFRDAVWLAVDDGRLDGRPLWLELGRRVPTPYDAAPLFLFGWASWRSGDGALARLAAERAVQSDPECSAADLLLAALAHGVNPHDLPRLRGPRSRPPASRRAARRSTPATNHARRAG